MGSFPPIMTSIPDPQRRFSDEEVRQLLKRAAELESQTSNLPAPRDGPTLAELEAIAAEAGINPAALRDAARELDTGPASTPERSGLAPALLGAPASLELEGVVSGALREGVLEDLIPFLQRASDSVGQPSLLGRTLTWQSTNPQSARQLLVTVTAGRENTRIFIEERYGNLAGGLFGGIMGGVGGGVGIGVGLGVGLGALGSALFATVFPLAVFGGSYFLSRGIFSTFVRKRRRVLERLMEDMRTALRDAVEEEPGQLPEGAADF